MSTWNILISILISGVIGFGGSLVYFAPKVSALQEQIVLRPPVIVIDMERLAIESVPVGSGDEAIKEHFRSVESAIDKFQNAGFLIFSRENLLSVPSDLLLNADDLSVNRYLLESSKIEDETH